MASLQKTDSPRSFKNVKRGLEMHRNIGIMAHIDAREAALRVREKIDPTNSQYLLRAHSVRHFANAVSTSRQSDTA